MTRSTPSLPAGSQPISGSSGLARLHAVATAVILGTTLLQPLDAHALALGRIAVQSALGEPLRAEVDVPEINAEEASSLRVQLAPSDAFRAAGMEISAALADLQISLQRRPDGRAYLRLHTSRPVNEPFMDLILEAQWASGRLVRDYTLLFDPPNLRPAPAPAPMPPSVTLPPASAPAPTHSPATQPATPTVRPPVPTPQPAERAAATPPAPVAAQAAQVRVKPGDTAGRIANANRSDGVSLDQMLVAMLRANPNAFIGGNVNRVRAGAVLDMPDASTAGSVPQPEARQIIAAQSRDFNEFRRRVAQTVPQASVATADRQASGRIEAEVRETQPAAPTQDKLTLSKPQSPAASAPEAKIAEERQSQDSATRVAELSRNVEELAKLNAVTPPAAPATAATEPTPAPSAQTEAPAAAEPTDTPTAPAPAEPAAAPEPAPAPAAAVPTPAPKAPPPAAEPSFLSQLTENPLVLPGAALLLALLAGLGVYKARQRKKAAAVDSSFLESRLQPDSFFGSSGGQRIDTAEATASGSSMVYSPSQLDAAGDVDPVAEADVYLAYGRDLQAEEILKEAMRATPTRVAIHGKLLEIYAKRRDARAFEVVANEAFALTQGQGPEWEHACELGRELDPANTLYQPGGQPVSKVAVNAEGAIANNTIPFGASTLMQNASDAGGADDADLPLDLDLDLDLDMGGAPAPAPSTNFTNAHPAVSGMADLDQTAELTQDPPSRLGPASMPMDFDLDFPSEPVPLDQPPSAPKATSVDTQLPDLSFDEPTPLAAATPAPADMLSFDLNDINLDLGEKAPEPQPMGLTEENPLETKLSLAEEFRAIGDLEGARSLAEEVLAEATGTLKTKASAFLADLT